jgi:hypothetical protein
MLGLEGAEIGGTMMCISVPALKVFGDRIVKSHNEPSGGEQPLRKRSEMTFTETEQSFDESKKVMAEKERQLDEAV